MIRLKIHTLVCFLSVAFCFSAACKSGGIDTKKAEKLIKKFLEDKLEGKKVKVDCPKDIKAKKDETFECKATVDGNALVITVTQQDDKGNVAWEVTSGLVEMQIGKRAQETLQGFMAKSLGTEITEVKCPDKIEVKTGGTFDCTTEADGVTVTAAVEQTDDKGGISYAITGGVVVTGKLAIMIQGELKANKVEAQVDCGQPIVVSKPGGTFECTATDGQGVSKKIAVVIKSNDGNVDWKVAE